MNLEHPQGSVTRGGYMYNICMQNHTIYVAVCCCKFHVLLSPIKEFTKINSNSIP